MDTVQTVLGFWDFFWIALVVMTFSGGTQYVMRNSGESEPLAPSLRPTTTLQARIKARLHEKRRPLVRASKWKPGRRPADALS
jgi:hypothetical protein